MKNWITSAARAQGIKQAFIAAAILAVMVMALAANADYIRNYVRGPMALSAQELQAGSPKAAGWVSMDADKLHETGMEEITVRKKRGVERGRSVTSVYYVAEIGQRLLLVKGVQGQGKALKGHFIPMSSDVQSALFSSPGAEAMRPQFHAQMLDTHDYDADGNLWLPIAGLIALAALVWGGIGLARYQSPSRHPAVKPFVAAQTLDGASNTIAQEIAAKQFVKLADCQLTPTHAIQQSLLSLRIQPLQQLVWAFKQVTQKKLYYVIPAGKSYAAKLHFHDTVLVLQGKEAAVDEALHHLAAHAPWAAYGYSDQLAAAYKDKKQRRELIALVTAQQQAPQRAS